jgi:predicted nucleic acid-binding protein
VNFLLDTCVVSELAKPGCDPQVKAWARSVNELDIYLSALTLGELQKGASKLPKSARKSRLLAWLHKDLLQRFDERILPITHEVALLWGELQALSEKRGKPIPVIDGLIAASALQKQLTVVTRNTQDMEASGVALLNPWLR